MLAVDMACQFGTLLSPLFDDPESLIESTRSLASIGDKSGFKPLPPVFLNDSPTASSQQLWAATSCYSAGGVPSMPPSASILGAAMLSTEHSPLPVLIFVDHTLKRVTSIVYNSRLSHFESQLYKFREQPTPLEVKWKGSAFAASHLQLFEMIGEYLKSVGKSSMPPHLLTKSADGYHLERTGPIPYLHMRTVANEEEFEMAKALILAHLSGKPPADPLPTPCQLWSFDDYTFQTFFTKASGSAAPGTEFSSEQEEAASKIANVPALAFAMASMIKPEAHTDPEGLQIGQMLESMTVLTGDFAATAATTPRGATATQPPSTISDLMGLSYRLYSVRNIGKSGGISQAYCLASFMFDPADVATAIREVAVDTSISSQKPIQSARMLIQSISKRVDPAFCVMCIELSSNREVKRIRLMNSESDDEIDIDCAGRLLDCPWVFPIGLAVYNRDTANFFTLEAKDLVRDALRVCSSLRQAYQLTAVLEQPIATVQAQVDFGPLDKRLESFEERMAEWAGSVGTGAGTSEMADLGRLKTAKHQLAQETTATGAIKKTKKND